MNETFLVRGVGSGQERAATALTGDRAMAVVYLPGTRDITIDLARMKGPQVRARWFDPADGKFVDSAQRVITSLGLETLRPPGLNGAGKRDWVLLLSSETSQSAVAPDAER